MRELFAAFEAENPDIHIVYDTSPDLEIVMEKAADLLAVDKAPSIISTNGNVQYVSNAKKKGVALDLTPYLKEDATFASDVVHRSCRRCRSRTARSIRSRMR